MRKPLPNSVRARNGTKFMPIQRAMQTLRLKLQTLRRAEFMRSVGVLVGGTAVAQVITLLALPVVTRIYSPSEFGAFGVFVSMLSLISAISCLRLEVAIPIPEKETEAVDLIVLTVLSCLVMAGIAAVGVLLFKKQILFLGAGALEKYLWMLPIGILVIGFYSILQFWMLRQKRFGIIASTRFKQAFGGAATQLSLGLLNFGVMGLILGYLINSGAGIFGFVISAIRNDKRMFSGVTVSRVKETLKKYIDYPKFSTLETFSSNGATQIPLIIISAAVGGAELGFLMLAVRSLAAPVALVSGAVSQVYLSKAPEEFRAGNIKPLTLGLISGLIKIGVGPIVFVGMVAHLIVPIVFGSDWSRAGYLIGLMAPWFVVQLLSNSVAMALYVLNKQIIALSINLFGFLLRCGAAGVSYIVMPSFVIESYIFSGFIFYLIYFVMVSKSLDIRIVDLFKVANASLPIIAVWLVAGGLINLIW